MMLVALLVINILANIGLCEIRLNGIFGDHMVLQKPDAKKGIPPTHLYGMALLTDTVYITGSSGFPGPFKVTPTTNDKNSLYGNWSVEIIPKTNEADGPYTITISPTNNQSTVTFSDIYFGEVFLCGGQSNMQVKISSVDDAAFELEAANSLPNIRINQIAGNYSNYTIQNLSSSIPWTVSRNSTIAQFSAICWIGVGRLISEYITSTTGKTPYIGLIESAVGGTTVHFWAPGIVGKACNETKQLPSKGECANGDSPGALFNAMINPISMYGNGTSIRAAVYYQGEADTGENDEMTQSAYTCEIMGLINQWREEFNQPNLTFVNVQLPPLFNEMPYSDIDNSWTVPSYRSWPDIQIAQLNAFNLLDNTGLAVNNDQGQHDLHYSHKIDVATRVSLWTQHLAFMNSSINPASPVYSNAFKESGDSLTVYIQVTNIQNGLQLKKAWNCSAMGPAGVIYTTNATNYSCCSMNGANVIQMRLEGIYFVEKENSPKLWNWVPAQITNLIDNKDAENSGYIVAEPILPQPGCYNFPPNTQQVFQKIKTVSIKKIAVGVDQQCSVVNTPNSMPLSISGPYDVVIDPGRVQQIKKQILNNKQKGEL